MHEIEIVLAAFRSVVTDRLAVYVSAPLTKGRRFLAWRSRHGRRFDDRDPEHHAERIREVVEPNRQEVSQLVELLRQRYPVVIDPTAFPDVIGWIQSDYRVLWGIVIQRYAATVVFANGWQYSSGCAYECLMALKTGAQCLDAREQEIDAGMARDLIAEAANELEREASRPEFLHGVLAELNVLRGCR